MLDLTPNQGERLISSKEVAALTGKELKHIHEKIRLQESIYFEVFGDGRDFDHPGFQVVKDNRGYIVEYQLTKSQSLFIVSGYSPVLRAKIQSRWEVLEQQQIEVIPTIDSDFILKIGTKMKELECKNNILTSLTNSQENIIVKQCEAITENQPKVDFADAVTRHNRDMPIKEFAKHTFDDFHLGHYKMMAKLRELNILIPRGNMRNMPYQRFVDANYFKTGIVIPNGRDFEVKTTAITPHGCQWLIKRLKTHYNDKARDEGYIE